MDIPFWKMNGAANDFVLADDREQTFPVDDGEWIASIAARRTGIGCEGVILIQPSQEADFRMRFFNPDGSEVEMCGNGTRCVARLAYEIGAAPQAMSIETVAGRLKAECSGDQVTLQMTPPRDWAMEQALPVDGETLTVHSVNSGVPHAVVISDDIDDLDVQKLGAGIRYHEAFAPAGANANFVQTTGPQSLRIRTYERGVEAETLACGTGMVAAALVAGRLGLVKSPVDLHCASGDHLQVGFRLTPDGAEQVTLSGPAVHVFKGTIASPT